ncbi:MAG: hypothetical protein NVSMB13_11590 [Mycobacteriales bacterium]
MQGALKISWGSAVRGREAKALEVFERTLEYFDELAKGGRVTGYRTYLSVSGRAGGLLLVEGDLGVLTGLLTEERMRTLRREAGLIVEDYEIQSFVGGDDQSLQTALRELTAAMANLGYL